MHDIIHTFLYGLGLRYSIFLVDMLDCYENSYLDLPNFMCNNYPFRTRLWLDILIKYISTKPLLKIHQVKLFSLVTLMSQGTLKWRVRRFGFKSLEKTSDHLNHEFILCGQDRSLVLLKLRIWVDNNEKCGYTFTDKREDNLYKRHCGKFIRMK